MSCRLRTLLGTAFIDLGRWIAPSDLTDRVGVAVKPTLEASRFKRGIEQARDAERWQSRTPSPADANLPDWLETDCAYCDVRRQEQAAAEGNFTAALMRRMIVCPDCGNKRCPKAVHHDNDCTGSNEPGQTGSIHA